MRNFIFFRFRKAWQILFLLEVVVIIVFSLFLAAPHPGAAIRFLDKIQHFFAYLVLGGTGFLAFSRPDRRLIAGMFVLLGCVCFGGVIEVLQNFTGRSMEAMDLLADIGGTFLGVTVAGLGSIICTGKSS